MWPFTKSETRDSSYTDSIIALIAEQASGATLAKPAATGALEASASIVARCFAAADVSGPDSFREALGPSVLSMIGRALIRNGEIVFAIEIRDGRVVLIPGRELGRYRRRGPGVMVLQAHLGRAVASHHA